MRIFVAGASGALGSRLVPQLIDAGHDVIGTHNSPTRCWRLHERRAYAGSSRRALRPTGTSGRAVRSRPKTIR